MSINLNLLRHKIISLFGKLIGSLRSEYFFDLILYPSYNRIEIVFFSILMFLLGSKKESAMLTEVVMLSICSKYSFDLTSISDAFIDILL